MPTSFTETRTNIMQAKMQQHPLGILVTLDPDGLNVNHPSFVLAPSAGDGALRAHAAQTNSFCFNVSNDRKALGRFQNLR